MQDVKVSNSGGIILLGKQGENLARKILFDISRWISSFGPGTVQLLHQRSGDEAPYPVAVEQDGTLAIWKVSSADTASAGTGRMELQYYVGDTLAKSETWMTKVLPALGDASETPPEAQQGWVDQVLQAGATAEEAAQRAEDAALNPPKLSESQTWMIWNPDTGEYEDTGVYSGGEAPTIGANGNWVIGGKDTGVSATGPTGAPGKDGTDGKDGADGQPGADGYSPTASVTQTETGAVVTITDKTGTTTAAIKNGEDGAPGKDGDPGEPGQTGATPNIQIGTVETLPAGSPATANMSGTTENPLLNLGIPQGEPGEDGRGIQSITGNDDGTWTVTYTDGTTEQISEEAYMALLSEMSAKLDALAVQIDNLPSGGGVSLADVDVYVADFYTDEVAVTAGALDVYKRIIIS